MHIFYTTRRRRKQFCFLGIQNGAIYTFFTQPAQVKIFGGFLGQNDIIYTHFGFFLRSKWCHIYTLFFFLRSKCCKTYTFLSVFGQNVTIYIHICFCFFGQNAATYTYLCLFLGSKCYHIYTFWVFFGVKMLPYIHISGI